MTILSKRLIGAISKTCRSELGLRPLLIDTEGFLPAKHGLDPIHDLAFVQKARAHALGEAVRWGEPFIFFMAPGVLSWVVPLVNQWDIRGGLIGGEVMVRDESTDRRECVQHLVSFGASRSALTQYIRRLPVWPQENIQVAADRLYEIFYQASGWKPFLLEENRERALQQRQIAEEIHRRKATRDKAYPLDEERLLISLIRTGDHKGARRLLNQMLGAVFLRSANLTIVRALMIELMGYLVRTAVEDSPFLESLMERNHEWTAKIIEARDFQELSNVLRDALDDFMNSIYLQGYKRENVPVRQALDYIAANYKEAITLEDVAQATRLSSFRIAHLMKEHTGKTILQHIHRMRVREAQRLLEQTSMTCADVAYEVGFGDQSYFTKHFRQITGTTPARHRREYRRKSSP